MQVIVYVTLPYIVCYIAQILNAITVFTTKTKPDPILINDYVLMYLCNVIARANAENGHDQIFNYHENTSAEKITDFYSDQASHRNRSSHQKFEMNIKKISTKLCMKK